MVLYPAMIFAFRAALGLLLATIILCRPVEAWAGEDTATAIRELSSNQDFRVRTQAALALGASGDASAVQPLCRALEDTKSAVRAAAAAALGKLGKGGRECLTQRASREGADSVKGAITRALQAISDSTSGQASSMGVVDASTRFYISIGKTADNTQRKKSTVHDVVRAALAKALAQQKGYVVGPDGETKAQYQKRVAGKKAIKGFLLSPKVQNPEYTGDSVSVRFEIAILTFPDKALKGMIPVKLTQQGSVKKNEGAEDELIAMAVERAVEKLLKNIERID